MARSSLSTFRSARRTFQSPILKTALRLIYIIRVMHKGSLTKLHSMFSPPSLRFAMELILYDRWGRVSAGPNTPNDLAEPDYSAGIGGADLGTMFFQKSDVVLVGKFFNVSSSSRYWHLYTFRFLQADDNVSAFLYEKSLWCCLTDALKMNAAGYARGKSQSHLCTRESVLIGFALVVYSLDVRSPSRR